MRDYFWVFPDRTMPDAYERTLPEVFPDFAPGSFSYDKELDGWVWTTFNDYQWDVNWSNPDVLCAYADIILTHANNGVEAFRLDAIAFTWKRMGTNCQNQPEVHALTQALRTVARIACPAVVFKAEAIVGPQDLLAYLGQGQHHGKVSDLAYHNSLMVQIWSMLASRDARLAAARPAAAAAGAVDDRLGHLRPVPRRHRLGDLRRGRRGGRASTPTRTGTSSPTSTPASSRARGRAAWCSRRTRQTGDRRISGSLASLAGLEAGDPYAVRPDPARARHRPRLRRPAGDLDGRRARDAQRRRTGPPTPRTPTTTGGCTGPRMPWPVTDDPHGIRAGIRRLVRGTPASCRTCTPRSPRRCSSRATPASSWWRAGTRSARCSAPTT